MELVGQTSVRLEVRTLAPGVPAGNTIFFIITQNDIDLQTKSEEQIAYSNYTKGQSVYIFRHSLSPGRKYYFVIITQNYYGNSSSTYSRYITIPGQPLR